MIHRTVTRPSPYCECDRCPCCGKPVQRRAAPGLPAPVPYPSPHATPYWSIYPPYTITSQTLCGDALSGTLTTGTFTYSAEDGAI